MITQSNTGHGHVVPRADGVKMRCGGLALCATCQMEKQTLEQSLNPTPPAAQVQGEKPSYGWRKEALAFVGVAEAGAFADLRAAVKTAAMIIHGLLTDDTVQLIREHRIALTPEYEGQWHAELYGDDGVAQKYAEGATPDEAVRAVLSSAALSAPPAAGWTRAEQHDDISGDFQGYCWIDGRTGQRHWLPHGMNPNEKEPTRTNGGPHRCLFAPEGWACIKQAQHEGPCMAVKLTEGECHATPPAAGVPEAQDE